MHLIKSQIHIMRKTTATRGTWSPVIDSTLWPALFPKLKIMESICNNMKRHKTLRQLKLCHPCPVKLYKATLLTLPGV